MFEKIRQLQKENEYLQRQREKLAIKECCQASEVSRSGYYQWLNSGPSQREKEDAALLKQIVGVFEANKQRYGGPRVTRELRQEQTVCGERRVAAIDACQCAGRSAQEGVPAADNPGRTKSGDQSD